MAIDIRDKYGRLVFHSDTNNAEDYARADAARQELTSYGGDGLSEDSITRDSVDKTNDFFSNNGNLGRPGNPKHWWE